MRLALEALAGWRELEAESGEELLHLNGLVELLADRRSQLAARARECGIACELLDAAAASGASA